jgi:K+-transporting ATPase KdpF subunit
MEQKFIFKMPTVSMTGLYIGKGDRIMSIIFWISGVVAAALLVYLFIALLRPEKFQ